jgi:hypothetical protein
VGTRFNAPPGWPPVPEGFVPPPGWQPDPSWPAAPEGWQYWVDDGGPNSPEASPEPAATPEPAASPQPDAEATQDQSGWASPYQGPTMGQQPGWGTGQPAESAASQYPTPGGGEPSATPTSQYPTAGTPYPGAGAGAGQYQGTGTGQYPGTGAGQYPGTGQYPGGGYGPYPGGGPYNPYDMQPGQGTCGYAIAALVLGILGLFAITAILSIIFGIIALVRIRRVPQKGKGLAITGIVLSCIWLALVGLGFANRNSNNNNNPSANAGSTPSSSSPASSVPTTLPASSTPTTPGSISVFSLKFGTCFDNPNASSVTTVTSVPCDQAHNAQVFGQFHVKGSAYPGDSSVKQDALSDCNGSAAGNLDRSKINNAMTIKFIYPLEGSWDLGQRTISCLLVSPTSNLKSSVLSPGAHS